MIVSLVNKIKNVILRVARIAYFYKGKYSNKKYVMIMPHAYMCRVDKYDIINYKSDSALTFLHYLLENELLTDYTLLVMSRDDADFLRYEKYVSSNYPNRKIEFFPYYRNKQYSYLTDIQQTISFYRCVSLSSYIFSSIIFDFQGLVSSQILVDLNYYTASLKNDIFDKNDPYYMGLDKVGHEYCNVVCPSELSIRLMLSEMTIPYKKYINLGMCRNDNLLDGNKCDKLRMSITDRVSYKVNTIVLYTPTHRDYEESLDNQSARSILGFDYDFASFECFLRVNGIVFICKLHPKQNAQVVEQNIPEGLILHAPSENYGLTELMQVSDCLVTDYTSAYLDYLFLDKPVIFNFYDIEKYSSLRGVPFVPMNSIAAGEIVENEAQLKNALLNLSENSKKFKLKREFVRNLFFTNIDNHSCERVYNYFF